EEEEEEEEEEPDSRPNRVRPEADSSQTRGRPDSDLKNQGLQIKFLELDWAIQKPCVFRYRLNNVYENN
ncbi:MAG: hypothetical protein ABGY29_16980, partial [bacterium]